MSTARPHPAAPTAGRARVVIEGVSPEIDAGRFPIKRAQGEEVVVEADVFAEGHDLVACALRWRHESSKDWNEQRMELLVNDRWRGSFTVHTLGSYEYTIVGWVDRFATWQRDLGKKVDAGQPVSIELLMGAEIVASATRGVRGAARKVIDAWVERLEATEPDPEAGLSPARSASPPRGRTDASSSSRRGARCRSARRYRMCSLAKSTFRCRRARAPSSPSRVTTRRLGARVCPAADEW